MSISLSAYFVGIGAKRISEVEIKPETSNQHEFKNLISCDVLNGSASITLLVRNIIKIS